MSVERNKAVVRRLFDVWNNGKLDAIEELYAADYVADYSGQPRRAAPARRRANAASAVILLKCSGNELMGGSEIDAVRALLSEKPRPVGWAQTATTASTKGIGLARGRRRRA